MNIAGVLKVSTIDFPGKLASVVFLQGCNMRCPFCHNSDLIRIKNNLDEADHERLFFEHLEARKGIIEGVVISGGEPTIHSDLLDFIHRIKNMGYAVKLDTNGTNHKMIAKLIHNNMLDYIAMDIKTSPKKYQKYFEDKDMLYTIVLTANAIMHSLPNYEFRTTMVKGLHTEEDLYEINKWFHLGFARKYVLQNYRPSNGVLSPEGLESFTDKEMEIFKKIIDTFGIEETEIR